MPPRDDDNHFRQLAESLPQLVWTARPDGTHDYYNRRWYEFTGLDPSRPIDDDWSEVIHPDDRPPTGVRWREALRTGGLYEVEYRIRSREGAYRWFLGRALPMRDESGAILCWFGTCTDIERQKNAEDALRRLDEQHRLALEAAELGTWDYTLETGTVQWDERTCSLFGMESHGIDSVAIDAAVGAIHEGDRGRVTALIEAACAAGSDGHFEAEYRVVHPDGTMRWVQARGQAAFAGESENRRAVRLSGVVGDVTRRRTSEETQDLLTRELNHRVKNLFAIASGLVSMTARTAKTPKDMADALRGRLGALSRAHELVRPAPANQHIHGTTVDKLAAAILAPYAQPGSDERLILAGPPIPVGPQTTTSLALVLHELATNAAKYGCLSSPEGRLAIRWTADENGIELTWTERGGPPVAEEPSHQGFGSQLARKTIAGQLGGTLQQDWDPSGLVVRMTLPPSRLGL